MVERIDCTGRLLRNRNKYFAQPRHAPHHQDQRYKHRHVVVDTVELDCRDIDRLAGLEDHRPVVGQEPEDIEYLDWPHIPKEHISRNIRQAELQQRNLCHSSLEDTRVDCNRDLKFNWVSCEDARERERVRKTNH